MSNYNVNLTDITDTRQVNVNVTTGDKGWSPELVMVRRESDGALVALREWVGGSGEKPTPPQYVAEDGFTDDIEEAVNFKANIEDIHIDENGDLIFTLLDGETINAGNAKGDPLPYSDWSPEDVDKLIQDVNINAQRIPAVEPGALPTPSQADSYMVVTGVGDYTYGGTIIGTNTDGYQTTFWWDGSVWSDNGSVRIKGDMPDGTDVLEEEEIPKGKAVINYVEPVMSQFTESPQLFDKENDEIQLAFLNSTGINPSTSSFIVKLYLKPNTTYTISQVVLDAPSTATFRAWFYRENDTRIPGGVLIDDLTFTTHADQHYTWVYIGRLIGASTYPLRDNPNVNAFMINEGTEVLPYTPFGEIKINTEAIPRYDEVLNFIDTPIIDDTDILQKLSRPTYYDVKKKIPLFWEKWKKRTEDVTVVVAGDSLSVRSTNNTQFENPQYRPPLCNGKNWASAVWDKLKWGREKFYRYDALGLDANPRFTETGSFVSVERTGSSSPTHGIDISIWDDLDRREGFTRMYSGSGNASVTFSMIHGTNDKEASLDFIYRTDLGGAEVCTVTIAEGNNLLKVWNGTAYVEANGFTFSMKHPPVSTYRGNTKFNEILRFKAVLKSPAFDSRNSAKTITITKTSTDDARFMYWGIQTSIEPVMMRIVSAGRGGLEFDSMLPFIDDDIFDHNPDLIIQEIPINGGLNVVGGSDIPQYYVDEANNYILNLSNPKSLKSNSGSTPWSNYEVVVWTPHVTQQAFFDDNSFISQKYSDGNWYGVHDNRRWIAQHFNKNEQTGVIFVDMFEAWLRESVAIYGNMKQGFTTSSITSESSFLNDGTHQNDLGVKIMDKHILSIFDL